MRTNFKSLIKFPTIILRLKNSYNIQKQFISKSIALEIAQSKSSNDGSISIKDYNKMIKYYGFAVPVVFDIFTILRGKKLSENERLSLTYLGGLTGLFDDLFDNKNISDDHILNLLENSHHLKGDNSYEILIIKYFNKALKYSAKPEMIKEYALKVFNAQIMSKKQYDKNVSKQELVDITMHKGGISMILFRFALENKMSAQEENLLYKLGALSQLENDIFDVYKDYYDGIKTLANTETNIENTKNIYISFADDLINSIQKTDFKKQNKEEYTRIVLIIICRGFTCLQMLKKNQKKTNNVFSIEKYSREELICDMEKPINILRTINYYAKYKF